MSEILCVVCHHRTPDHGYVCNVDRKRIATQLSELPQKVTALTLQLVPGTGASLDERVATSRTGSPVGARLDVLNLTGPGADRDQAAMAGMLHPQIRKWRTTHTVTVTVWKDGRPEQEQREIVSWEQEIVRDDDGQPVLVSHDDQIGLLPPGEWLAWWTRSWRHTLGHNGPLRKRGQAKDAVTARRNLDTHMRLENAKTLLGLHGNVPVADRPTDPLADEWTLRFGGPARDRAVTSNATYLVTWLDDVCDQDPQIAQFAAELRALTAELDRVLGEQPDQQWLGRCPTSLTHRETGTSTVCGAGLWQDPWASQVVCPRCRSTWGPIKLDLLRLASAIRKVWPVDRRRMYTLEEFQVINAQNPLRCPTCAGTVTITWRAAGARGERYRWQRPVRAFCRAGCPDAERLI